MKKILLSTVLTAFMFTACQKEEVNPISSDEASKPIKSGVSVSPIGPVPATFMKKVLAEEFAGTNEGLTPDASFDINNLRRQYPDMVYSASLHVNDVMASNAASSALRLLTTQPLTYPCGMIDRKPFHGNLFLDSKQYDNAVQMIVNRPADCGLAISTSMVGLNSAQIDVRVGFNAKFSNCEVQTYLIEDGIINSDPDFEQINSLNTTPGSLFFGAGNPILNYEHKNVVRRLLGKSPINSVNMVAGGSQIFSTFIDLPAQLSSVSKFKILSFITNASTNEVLNVQECELGQVKSWN